MKVGMNLLLWTGAATKEHYPLFKQLKSFGFDGVELPMFSTEGSDWKELKTVLGNEGLASTVVSVPAPGSNFIGETAAERAAALDFFKGCIDASKTLGAEVFAGPLCSPVGRLVGRGRTQQEWDWCVDGMQKLCDYAKGITVSVEPLNRFETYFLNSTADSAEFCKAVGRDNCGFLYDTFHANIEEKKVADAIRAGGKYINHVHISANDRATPGEDHVDYKTNFATLKEIGYDGWLMIEAFGLCLPELAAATCIWRKMAPSEEHVAREGCKFIRANW
ncbi:MAG: sugar phosphate isomerase/epimerase family protein [Candidatus Hydrogenedentes bacterium]|nr:sugar phosphate isomerase/epimerase family protein [Candidatus Hydrogenedentota bacterium]